MTFINPQPENSVPIIKPRKDETLQSWLTRKNHATTFYSFYKELPLSERREYEDQNFHISV